MLNRSTYKQRLPTTAVKLNTKLVFQT